LNHTGTEARRNYLNSPESLFLCFFFLCVSAFYSIWACRRHVIPLPLKSGSQAMKLGAKMNVGLALLPELTDEQPVQAARIDV
jgi:hypothetical protein